MIKVERERKIQKVRERELIRLCKIYGKFILIFLRERERGRKREGEREREEKREKERKEIEYFSIQYTYVDKFIVNIPRWNIYHVDFIREKERDIKRERKREKEGDRHRERERETEAETGRERERLF